MGAAASIEKLYVDAFAWFKQYVDTETYIEDFNAIDHNSDGSISFVELQHWIAKKAKIDHSWQVFVKNPLIVKAAYNNSAKRSENGPDKIVDITDFRHLLLHLFATSVLWAHFQNADNWEEGADPGNKQLNFEEFRLACLSLCSTHAGENLTEEQIREDFIALDTNNSDSIQFLEVSNYCYTFVEKAVVSPGTFSKEAGLLSIIGDLKDQVDSSSPSDRTNSAMGYVARRVAHESNAAVGIAKTASTPTTPVTPVTPSGPEASRPDTVLEEHAVEASLADIPETVLEEHAVQA